MARTGNQHRIPPPLDQCAHCGAIFYSPCEAQWCVVYDDLRARHHVHVCAVHARQILINERVNDLVYAAEIPLAVGVA